MGEEMPQTDDITQTTVDGYTKMYVITESADSFVKGNSVDVSEMR